MPEDLNLTKPSPIAIAGEFLISESSVTAAPTDVLPSLQGAAQTAASSFEAIAPERRQDLEKMAACLRERGSKGEAMQIIFICTHNSRRSHFSQVWAQTAAAWYGVKGFQAFSGGVEVTACNGRTVAALRRAGFDVSYSTGGKNPIYLVRYSPTAEPLRSFSKVYDNIENPKYDFVAAMTCDHADGACPLVRGAGLRVLIHYIDPKVSDGTPEEAATYDERSRQIAGEMFYLLSRIADK